MSVLKVLDADGSSAYLKETGAGTSGDPFIPSVIVDSLPTLASVTTVTTVSAVTSITNTVTTKETRSATATSANVASSATNVTLLAANANRLGATIYNDSTQVLYVKLGTTASASSFTLQMAAGTYYEVPFAYTGNIDGIWASANGAARVTEMT